MTSSRQAEGQLSPTTPTKRPAGCGGARSGDRQVATMRAGNQTEDSRCFAEVPMLDRRSFLRSPLAANLGRPIPRQRAGASHNDWAYLGRKAWRYLGVPRDQASLRRGLHPIAPERVVVLTEQRWSGDQHPLTQDLRERFHGKLSAEKVGWIVRLTTVLADHYHVPPSVRTAWAVGLAKREALGSCPLGLGLGRGLGAGVALLHQFQFQ